MQAGMVAHLLDFHMHQLAHLSLYHSVLVENSHLVSTGTSWTPSEGNLGVSQKKFFGPPGPTYLPTPGPGLGGLWPLEHCEKSED